MEYPTPRMTLTGILKFDEGIKLEYSDPNWNIWGSKALIGISPTLKINSSRIWVHSRKSEIFTGERAGQFSQYSPNLACLGSR